MNGTRDEKHRSENDVPGGISTKLNINFTAFEPTDLIAAQQGRPSFRNRA
jgi:hypothetical protein